MDLYVLVHKSLWFLCLSRNKNFFKVLLIKINAYLCSRLNTRLEHWHSLCRLLMIFRYTLQIKYSSTKFVVISLQIAFGGLL